MSCHVEIKFFYFLSFKINLHLLGTIKPKLYICISLHRHFIPYFVFQYNYIDSYLLQLKIERKKWTQFNLKANRIMHNYYDLQLQGSISSRFLYFLSQNKICFHTVGQSRIKRYNICFITKNGIGQLLIIMISLCDKLLRRNGLLLHDNKLFLKVKCGANRNQCKPEA